MFWQWWSIHSILGFPPPPFSSFLVLRIFHRFIMLVIAGVWTFIAPKHIHTQREEERRGKRDVCMLVHIWCDKKFVLNVIEHEAAHIRSSISCFVRSFVCRMALRSIVLFAMHFPNWANWLTEHMNVPMWELMFVYFAFVQNAFDSMEHQMHEKLFLSYRLMLILMLELWLHWSIHYYHPT